MSKFIWVSGYYLIFWYDFYEIKSQELFSTGNKAKYKTDIIRFTDKNDGGFRKP